MKYIVKYNSSIGLLQFFPIRDKKIYFKNKNKANAFLKKNFFFNHWLGYWAILEARE